MKMKCPSIRGKGRHSIQVRQLLLLLLLLLLVGVSGGCHGVGGCRRRRRLRWQVAAGRGGGGGGTGVSAPTTTSAPTTSGECHLQPWDLQQPAVRLSALAAGAVALGQRPGVSLHETANRTGAAAAELIAHRTEKLLRAGATAPTSATFTDSTTARGAARQSPVVMLRVVVMVVVMGQTSSQTTTSSTTSTAPLHPVMARWALWRKLCGLETLTPIDT
ncbi:hypothetical protein TYRP_015566 [Tyrophagus putrescentiae]|nr:hypothetical protein TYRP_015566 [Tyrophagus putrescentiae]